MQGIKIGENVTDTFGFERSEQAPWNQEHEGLYTIFDSASPDILIPILWFDDFVEKFNITSLKPTIVID